MYKMNCPDFINIVCSFMENSIDKSKYTFSIRILILILSIKNNIFRNL